MDTQATAPAPRRRRFKQAAGYLLAASDSHGQAMRDQMQKYCEERGLALAEVYVDSASKNGGTNFDERPAARRLLDEMKARRVRHIIIPELNAMFTDVADMALQMRTFKRRKRQLHILRWMPVTGEKSWARRKFSAFSTEDDPTTAAVFWRTVSAVGYVAEGQARRHTQGDGRKFAGLVNGSVPYGFDRIGRGLYPNELEQAVIGRIKRMMAAGASLHDIAHTLNAEGIAAKKGGKWYPASVKWVASKWQRTETFRREQEAAARA